MIPAEKLKAYKQVRDLCDGRECSRCGRTLDGVSLIWCDACAHTIRLDEPGHWDSCQGTPQLHRLRRPR